MDLNDVCVLVLKNKTGYKRPNYNINQWYAFEKTQTKRKTKIFSHQMYSKSLNLFTFDNWS